MAGKSGSGVGTDGNQARGEHRRDGKPARRPEPRLVISLADGDPYGAGGLRAVRQLSGIEGTEYLALDPAAGPFVIGREADTKARAILILAAPDLGAADRMAYAERACRIAAATRHPVLMVPASASWPPQHCLAATDFGRPSITAASAAIELLEVPGRVTLAFVDADLSHLEGEPISEIPSHLRILFDALPMTVGEQPGVTILPTVLGGGRVPTLLAFATVLGVDLISIGRQGRSTSAGVLGRRLGPTVRTMLERADCAVLVAGSA